MAAWVFRRKKSGNLRAQIKAVELQLMQRQDSVEACSAQMIINIQRQMTSPSSLMLAGSTGFILGEMSKEQDPALLGTAENSAFRTLISFITLVSNVYRALPASLTLNGL